MMDTESNNTHDINRLCEVLGIDASAYVSFERRTSPARKPAVIRIDCRSSEQPLPEPTAVPEPLRNLPAAFAAFEGISPALLNRSGIPAKSHKHEASKHIHPKIRPTQIALLSIAGGTGKTVIAAMLGRVLAGRGHSVLLADHSLYSTMHDLFAMRKDPLTSISFAHGIPLASPLPILSCFHDGVPLHDFEPWFSLISARSSFTFLDGMTNVVTTGRELVSSGARILIPVLPDLVSAMSAMRLDTALESPWPGRVNYVLNRFDANQQSHLDVKAWLRENLGARLLPFEIGEDIAVRQVAAGSLPLNDLPDHSSARHSMEFLADWLEARCAAGYAGEAEVG
jgi:cellulose biosynthesis protein BcsQ